MSAATSRTSRARDARPRGCRVRPAKLPPTRHLGTAASHTRTATDSRPQPALCISGASMIRSGGVPFGPFQPCASWRRSGHVAVIAARRARVHPRHNLVDLRLTQAAIVAPFAVLPSAYHGGIWRATTLFLMARAQGRTSSYDMSDIGATSPGRWHMAHFGVDDRSNVASRMKASRSGRTPWPGTTPQR